MITKNSNILMSAYALVRERHDLSVGEQEILFREISGEKNPKRGYGSGYVLFAGLQANDPKAKRNKSYSKSETKDLTEKSIKLSEFYSFE